MNAKKVRHFAWRSNDRARRMGVPGRLKESELKATTGPCAYCGGEATGWDHVKAMTLGGPNVIGNIVPSCWPCNREKARDEQRTSLVRLLARPAKYGRRDCNHARERRGTFCRTCVRNQRTYDARHGIEGSAAA